MELAVKIGKKPKKRWKLCVKEDKANGLATKIMTCMEKEDHKQVEI